SPRRSPRTARLPVLPREEGRCFFQELVLHPQPGHLGLEFLHARTLHRRNKLVRFRVLVPPGIDPVPQGPVVDPQVPGHLSTRLTGLDPHGHGLSFELRAELPPMLWHRTDPLSGAESHCPRSLIHLTCTCGLWWSQAHAAESYAACRDSTCGTPPHLWAT